MPLPTVITDLSTTASSNYPAGSELPSTLDDSIRAVSSILRKTYDDFGGANFAYASTKWTFTGSNAPNVKVIGATSATSYSAFFTGATQIGLIGDRNGVTGGTALDFALRADVALVFSSGGATERLGIESDGRVYGTGLHNNGTVTGTAKQYFASGTYTPTLTNGTNASASAASVCQWSRCGNVVIVSGKFAVTPTVGSGTATKIGMSLPIASAIASDNQMGGSAQAITTQFFSGPIYADATNDRAQIDVGGPSSGVSCDFAFLFSYLIV